jgi:hypothetical protein
LSGYVLLKRKAFADNDDKNVYLPPSYHTFRLLTNLPPFSVHAFHTYLPVTADSTETKYVPLSKYYATEWEAVSKKSLLISEEQFEEHQLQILSL